MDLLQDRDYGKTHTSRQPSAAKQQAFSTNCFSSSPRLQSFVQDLFDIAIQGCTAPQLSSDPYRFSFWRAARC
jgi:hypothetical protein